MLATNRQVLTDLLRNSCTSLFESYGVDLVPSKGSFGENLVLAGLIGFTAKELRGSLIVAASEKPLHQLTEGPDQRDWIQELANQLLGRVKNRLLAFDLNLQMTTPLSLRGEHLLLQPHGEDSIQLKFDTSKGGGISILMDVEVHPSLALDADINPETVCPSEGDLLLF